METEGGEERKRWFEASTFTSSLSVTAAGFAVLEKGGANFPRHTDYAS